MQSKFDVLISYSSKDQTVADDVLTALESINIRCWIAHRDIEPGRVWPDAIMEALEKCSILLLILTSSSNGTRQVLREIEGADRLLKEILLFRVEDVELARGLQYFLNTNQWIDASKPSYSYHLTNLAAHISTKIRTATVGEPLAKGGLPLKNEITATPSLIAAKEALIQLNYEKAYKFLLDASRLGSGQADYFLGRMYEQGHFLEKMVSKAEACYKLAIEKGCGWGYYGLGNVLYEARVTAQDQINDIYSKSFESVYAAAEELDPFACLILGNMFYYGLGVRVNKLNAVKWYEASAQKQYPMGQNNLACMYRDGEGIKQNYVQALALFTKAADKGLELAQCNLGGMYEFGSGVSINYKKAIEWYKKAADQGFAEGKGRLGRMYVYGIGTPSDLLIGFQWVREAAEQEFVPSQTLLAALYMDGSGIPRNHQKAFHWFTKAAEKGDMNAQNAIGEMYKLGEGVSRDYKKAIEWYTKAADANFASAQYNLGLMYQKGLGVPVDVSGAKWLFRRAAEQGYEDAIAILKKL